MTDREVERLYACCVTGQHIVFRLRGKVSPVVFVGGDLGRLNRYDKAICLYAK